MKPHLKGLLWALVLIPSFATAQIHYANDGIVDLRSVDFSIRTVSLRGEWAFFGSALVKPEAFPDRIPQPDYIDFPTTWNHLNKNRKPGNGYATYWLRILISERRQMALELPHFYSNYTLWINEKKIAENGVVGTSPATSLPQWLPQTVLFKPDADTLDVVIHVSNFHHALGGIRENILMGSVEALSFKRNVATTSYIAMGAVLLLIAVVALVVHLFGKNDPGFLYLSLLAFTWSIRAMFSNLYIAHNYIPGIPWEIGVKIEYISLYLMMIWAILFVSSIFRGEVATAFKILFTAANVVFTFLTLLFDAAAYTQFLPVYLSTAGLILLYTIYILVKAIISEQEGVWLMVTCLFLAVMLFAYDIVSYEGFATFNPIVVNSGYIIIFVLLSLALMYKPGGLKKRSGSANMLRYEDLYSSDRNKN